MPARLRTRAKTSRSTQARSGAASRLAKSRACDPLGEQRAKVENRIDFTRALTVAEAAVANPGTGRQAKAAAQANAAGLARDSRRRAQPYAGGRGGGGQAQGQEQGPAASCDSPEGPCKIYLIFHVGPLLAKWVASSRLCKSTRRSAPRLCRSPCFYPGPEGGGPPASRTTPPRVDANFRLAAALRASVDRRVFTRSLGGFGAHTGRDLAAFRRVSDERVRCLQGANARATDSGATRVRSTLPTQRRSGESPARRELATH